MLLYNIIAIAVLLCMHIIMNIVLGNRNNSLRLQLLHYHNALRTFPPLRTKYIYIYIYVMCLQKQKTQLAQMRAMSRSSLAIHSTRSGFPCRALRENTRNDTIAFSDDTKNALNSQM